MIRIFTDHLSPVYDGLHAQPVPMTTLTGHCSGCGVQLGGPRFDDTEWDKGYIHAEMGANGGRWRTERDGVSRCYCPACQRKVDGGKWGWMDSQCRPAKMAPLPPLVAVGQQAPLFGSAHAS